MNNLGFNMTNYNTKSKKILFILISENNLLTNIEVIKCFLNKNLPESFLLIIDNNSDSDIVSELLNHKRGKNIDIHRNYEKNTKAQLVNTGLKYGTEHDFDYFTILNSNYKVLIDNLYIFLESDSDFVYYHQKIPKFENQNKFEYLKIISNYSKNIYDEMLFLLSKKLIEKNNVFSKKISDYNDAFNEYFYRILLNNNNIVQLTDLYSQINIDQSDNIIKIYSIIFNWDFAIIFYKNTYWSLSEKKNSIYYSLDFRYIKIITTNENLIYYNEDSNILIINNQYVDVLLNYYKSKSNVFIVFDDPNIYNQIITNTPHIKTICLDPKNEIECECDYIIENLNELNTIIEKEIRILFVSDNNEYDNYTNLLKKDLYFDFCYYNEIKNMIHNELGINRLGFYDIIVWQNITEKIPEKDNQEQIYYHIIHNKEPIFNFTFMENYGLINHHIFASDSLKKTYELIYKINIPICDFTNLKKNNNLSFNTKNDYIVPNEYFKMHKKLKGNIFCYKKINNQHILVIGNNTSIQIYNCTTNYNKVITQLVKEYTIYELECLNMELDNNNDLILYVGDKENIKLFKYDMQDNKWDKNYFILYHNNAKIKKIEIDPQNQLINIHDQNENNKKLIANYSMYCLEEC
jgi:hypothetical protein